VQPGGASSLPCSLVDLTVHVPPPAAASLPGIARFYAHVLGAPALPIQQGAASVSVVMAPQQTLTFCAAPEAEAEAKAELGPPPTPHAELEFDGQVGWRGSAPGEAAPCGGLVVCLGHAGRRRPLIRLSRVMWLVVALDCHGRWRAIIPQAKSRPSPGHSPPPLLLLLHCRVASWPARVAVRG
jgi:hypothetical protein